MKSRKYESSFEGQWEVLQVEFIGVLQIILRNLCLSVFFHRNYVKPSAYLTEFITLTFPMLFCLTIFSEHLTAFVVFLVALCGILTMVQISLNRRVFYISRNTDYLTYFRTGMFIGTSIGIMAVDFKVWPERFGKTVKYGISVMDIGTAFFVISMALAEYFHANNPNRSTTTSSGSSKRKPWYLSTFAMLLGIGIIKEFVHYILDYHHSVIEYGEHWNFFFTLAFLKLFTTVFPYPQSISVGLLLGLSYQICLSLGLETWLLRFDRNSWNPIDANREGIFSLFGYIFMYSTTLVIAEFVAAADGIFNPSINSGILCMICAVICFINQLLSMQIFGEPSRRIANIPYVFAMVSTKIIQVGCFQFMHVWDSKRSQKREMKMLNLIEGISSNCLWYFLIANLAVLFINLMFNPGEISDVSTQMLLLIAYNFVTISIIYFWYLHKNVKKSFSKALPVFNISGKPYV